VGAVPGTDDLHPGESVVADLPHCDRCGRPADPQSTEFLDWRITAHNVVICPGCLTPLDHNEHTGHADAGSLTAAYRDDEILRQLDPDNDDQERP
jgi:hypothetical protein